MTPSLRGLIHRHFHRHAGAAGHVADAELLERFVAQRDEAAFELLLWRHGGMVLHLCRSLLGDAHAAEDAFQATFLTLVRRASAIRKREALAGWLHQVACRIALRLRGQAAARRERERPDPLLVGAALAPPDDNPDQREGRVVLHEELERLPSKYRHPLVLCYFEGLTHQEAALQLGWPVGTVAGRLARAKEFLHRRLTGRGVTLSGAGIASLLAGDAARATVPATLAQTTLTTVTLAVSGRTAAIAARVLFLSQGVVRTMLWEKAKHLAALILILATAAGGAGWLVTAHLRAQAALAQAPAGAEKDNPALKGGDGKGRDDPKAKADDSMAAHLQTQNNLKKIGLAMHNHADTHRVFPGPAIFSADGKPLLSWRVALLPYLDQHDLYKQFRLDEPWDSEHNKPLLKKIPDVYRSPGAKDAASTHFQVFVGQRTIFEGPKGIGFAHIVDGTSNTILVVEAAAAVPWTKPEDLAYAATGKIPELGGVFPGVFYVLFADGQVHALKQRFDPQDLRIAITRDEGLETPRKKLIDPAPTLDNPAKLKAELDKQMRSLRKTQDDVQHLRGTLLDLHLAAARERGVGAVDQLKWEYEVILDELERARSELASLRARIEELRKNR